MQVDIKQILEKRRIAVKGKAQDNNHHLTPEDIKSGEKLIKMDCRTPDKNDYDIKGLLANSKGITVHIACDQDSVVEIHSYNNECNKIITTRHFIDEIDLNMIIHKKGKTVALGMIKEKK